MSFDKKDRDIFSFDFLPPDKQKRSYPRVRTSIKAKVVFLETGREEEGTIVDLSEGGAKVELPVSLIENEKVKIIFSLEGYTISVMGEAIRIEGRKAGIRFIDLDDIGREKIRNLVHKTFFPHNH